VYIYVHLQEVGVIAAPAVLPKARRYCFKRCGCTVALGDAVKATYHRLVLFKRGYHRTRPVCWNRLALLSDSDVFVLQCRRILSSSVLVRQGSTSVLPPPAKAANLE